MKRTLSTIVRPSSKSRVCLVTPALADANNGNWQTARRWADMLSNEYRVELLKSWQGESCDAMIALHARRSADSIVAFAKALPHRPLVVALTGTDLYCDLDHDKQAQTSVALATRLIVLQDQAPKHLAPAARAKTDVCYQSTAARATLLKPPIEGRQRLRAVMVGHLRDVKDPRTAMRAMERLSLRHDIHLEHIGAPLDAGLAKAARKLSAQQSNYRWLGALSHGETLARIRRAHVLVHPSIVEGGAHVVMEAVQSGTPVLASRMPGNVGMLGARYSGYFEVGDDAHLATLLERARDDSAWLHRLERQADLRSSRFAPEQEQMTLLRILKRARRDATHLQASNSHSK